MTVPRNKSIDVMRLEADSGCCMCDGLGWLLLHYCSNKKADTEAGDKKVERRFDVCKC
jgi:hypothetical protein